MEKVVDNNEVKNFIDKKIKEGSVPVLEENLDILPKYYIDAVMFIHHSGMRKREDFPGVAIMDEDLSNKVMENLDKKVINLLVFKLENEKRENNIIYDLCMTKTPDQDPPKAVYVGSKNLRRLCDSKGIYYRSFLDNDGKLISSTTFEYEQNPEEDCSVPLNKEQGNVKSGN